MISPALLKSRFRREGKRWWRLISVLLLQGTYARIAPRSGLAWKNSIDVRAGVIDADYRGPVGVILFNHSDVEFEVKAGDRIAQLIIQKIMTTDVIEVDDLDSTLRGAGGFGSTGGLKFTVLGFGEIGLGLVILSNTWWV